MLNLFLNIQVGAVNVDSGWSTGYNNFVFDTKKFPNATEMVSMFYYSIQCNALLLVVQIEFPIIHIHIP